MAKLVDGASRVDGASNSNLALGPRANDIDSWNESWEGLAAELSELCSLSNDDCCIYRVPETFFRVNEEAYRPRAVSIGPLHCDSAHLQVMKSCKLRCLESYLERPSNKESGFNLKSCTEWAERVERDVRRHYQDTIELSPKELSKIILLDGVFIVELFAKNYFLDQRQARDEIDEILETKLVNDLLHDLMLLENQLPCYILRALFDKLKPDFPTDTEFVDLTHRFFKFVGNTALLLQLNDNVPRPLLRSSARHLLDQLLCIQTMTGGRIPSYRPKLTGLLEYPCTATVLQAAGVKFGVSVGISLLDIEFREGFLRMPKLTVNEWTESLFRNLAAFEHCDHRPGYVTSYIIFMDSIIKTPKDVDILVKCGIIENLIGDSKQVSRLFNDLYKEVVTEDSCFCFNEISKKLNAYSKFHWHRRKAPWFKSKLILMPVDFSILLVIIFAVAMMIMQVLLTSDYFKSQANFPWVLIIVPVWIIACSTLFFGSVQWSTTQGKFGCRNLSV